MSAITIQRGTAPLILTFPHAGTALPDDLVDHFVSPWLALRDADWHIDHLYSFAADLGATLIRPHWSRSVIDLNRDPSGQSLYPGQATTGLCPTESFDGEPLYKPDREPDGSEIDRRKDVYFIPFHTAVETELARLRQQHGMVFLYDCHSIRSRIPRLFAGELPHFNIGTNDGASCDPRLTGKIADICANAGRSHVVNGRFKGGWITRHYGQPAQSVQAVQMELAIRGYLPTDPDHPTPSNWPPAWDAAYAAPLQADLKAILSTILAFAAGA